MGFAVGGEYTGVVAYLLEGSRPERRGLITSWAAAASEARRPARGRRFGAHGILARFAPSVEAWGWRIPFLFGAALAGSVWIARSAMHESPEFVRQQRAGTVPKSPLRHSLSTQRLGILRAFAISALGSITYYVGITYVPSFLTAVGALSERDSLWISTGAAVVVILVTPLTGLLSDRWGRKPVLLLLCAASALLPITLVLADVRRDRLEALAGALILAARRGRL